MQHHSMTSNRFPPPKYIHQLTGKIIAPIPVLGSRSSFARFNCYHKITAQIPTISFHTDFSSAAPPETTGVRFLESIYQVLGRVETGALLLCAVLLIVGYLSSVSYLSKKSTTSWITQEHESFVRGSKRFDRERKRIDQECKNFDREYRKRFNRMAWEMREVIKMGHHEVVIKHYSEAFGPKEHILWALHHLDEMKENGMVPKSLLDLGDREGIKIVTRLDGINPQNENMEVEEEDAV